MATKEYGRVVNHIIGFKPDELPYMELRDSLDLIKEDAERAGVDPQKVILQPYIHPRIPARIGTAIGWYSMVEEASAEPVATADEDYILTCLNPYVERMPMGDRREGYAAGVAAAITALREWHDKGRPTA